MKSETHFYSLFHSPLCSLPSFFESLIKYTFNFVLTLLSRAEAYLFLLIIMIPFRSCRLNFESEESEKGFIFNYDPFSALFIFPEKVDKLCVHLLSCRQRIEKSVKMPILEKAILSNGVSCQDDHFRYYDE